MSSIPTVLFRRPSRALAGVGVSVIAVSAVLISGITPLAAEPAEQMDYRSRFDGRGGTGDRDAQNACLTTHLQERSVFSSRSSGVKGAANPASVA
jgi:hypothetical protein